MLNFANGGNCANVTCYYQRGSFVFSQYEISPTWYSIVHTNVIFRRKHEISPTWHALATLWHFADVFRFCVVFHQYDGGSPTQYCEKTWHLYNLEWTTLTLAILRKKTTKLFCSLIHYLNQPNIRNDQLANCKLANCRVMYGLVQGVTQHYLA
jgi:hypothetical protein